MPNKNQKVPKFYNNKKLIHLICPPPLGLSTFFKLILFTLFRISNNIGHPISGSGGKKTVKKDQKPKKIKKKVKKNFFLRGDCRQFSNKNVHIWDHFFPLLFPKDSEPLKILDIRLREVGARRPLKKTENRRRRPKKVKKKTFFCAAI